MTRNEIFSSLCDVMQVVKPGCDLTSATESTELLTDLGLDSLTMLLLSMGIEQKFGFEFPSDAVLKTIGDVIDQIEKATVRA